MIWVIIATFVCLCSSIYAVWLSRRVRLIVDISIKRQVKVAKLNREILEKMTEIRDKCDCCDRSYTEPKSYWDTLKPEEKAAMEAQLERIFDEICSDDSKSADLDYEGISSSGVGSAQHGLISITSFGI